MKETERYIKIMLVLFRENTLFGKHGTNCFYNSDCALIFFLSIWQYETDQEVHQKDFDGFFCKRKLGQMVHVGLKNDAF